jgi:pimeloyl-ACP methyl ester carboxylesterase
VNSVALAFDEQGSGPPLIILHGLFGSARNWQSHARALAGSYRVISVDQRNHGRSPHTGKHGYAEMAEDLAYLIGQLGLREVTLLGHSMGGKTAMTLALQGTVDIARLVLVDIGPMAYADQHTPIIEAMLAMPLTEISRRQQADEFLAPTVNDPTLRQFLLQNLQVGEDGAAWRINLPALLASMAALTGTLPVPMEARFNGPTQVIRGSLSDRVTEACLPAFRARFPRLEVHTVEGAGHWPHAEAPGAFRICLERALLA